MDKLSLEISNLCIGTYAFMLAQSRLMHQQEAGLISLSAIGRSLQGEHAKRARLSVQQKVIDALQNDSDRESAEPEDLFQLLTRKPVLFGQKDRSNEFIDCLKNDIRSQLTTDLVLGLFMSRHEKSTNPAMILAITAGIEACHTDDNLRSEFQKADYRDLALGVLHKGEYANQIDHDLEFFLRSCTDTESCLAKPLLFCLALRFALKRKKDLFYNRKTRLLELQRALDIACTDSNNPTTNLDKHHYLARTFTEVDSLNRDGLIDLATKTLRDAESHENIDLCELYDKGIAQAMISNNADLVCEYEYKRISLSEYEPKAYLEAFERVISQWHDQGQQLAMAFDIEVANGLAELALQRLQLPEHEEVLYNLVGKTCFALGEQQDVYSGDFRRAAFAFEKVLKTRPRERVPLKWAQTQFDLGAALQRQGSFARGEERATILESAIVAYRNALEESTLERAPMDWALTHQAIGDTLQLLFFSTKNEEQLQQAIIAYELASEEITQEKAPCVWAEMQLNIGNVLLEIETISSKKNDSQLKRIETAKLSFLKASNVFSQQTSPIKWAKIQAQLASVEFAYACHPDIEDQISHAHMVIQYANAALEELDEFENFLQYSDVLFLRDHTVKYIG